MTLSLRRASACLLLKHKAEASLRKSLLPESKLRVYSLRQFFSLIDAGDEEALYDLAAMRHFAHTELREEAGPDESTILCFCPSGNGLR